jgi:tRNA1(Val) A37 N6-methylase TrmN6
VEADPALAALAGLNFSANGFDRCRAEVAVIPALPASAGEAAHAFANPPWHEPGSTKSSDPGRRLARHREAGTIGIWAGALAGTVVQGGTVSMIVPAALHLEVAGGLEAAGCGGLVLFPLWPRAGMAAKLVMVRGVRGARRPARVCAGLVLHGEDGGFTGEAEGILRGGQGICP